ncbi:MAG: tRNA (adenosine(37)-N6)-dimethylallyltransferase MiaA [Cryomorphaceae bacterium]|nr:tRNA (adenosine(37)-N6)-dimethylallyltransferase MiaA [Flavobacteriales bacterium]
MAKKQVLVVCGPTAVGKTELSVRLAKKYNGEIISADSRQFFRGMNIGTAKPSAEEMDGIPHHFIDSLSVGDSYTAGNFEADALRVIDDLFAKNKLPIIAGGSGLYIKAAMEGLDELPSDENLRKEIEDYFEKNGLKALQHRLRKTDKEKYRAIDEKNHVRLIRAIEIAELGGEKANRKAPTPRNFSPIYIALNIPREELYSRIDARVDQMIAEGLEEEVRSLVQYSETQALQTVGYREMFPYFEGERSRETAINLIKRNTRRYAKRQLTWLRSVENIKWFHPVADLQAIFYHVEKATQE